MGDIGLSEGFKLNVHHFFNCSFDRYLLFGFFVNFATASLGFTFFGEDTHHSFLFLGFLGDRHFLLYGLFLVPGVEIGNDGMMFLHKIVVLEIVFVAVFDSFEGVVVGVKVVAGSDEGGIGEVDLLVEVLFEEEFQHLKKYYHRAR